MRLAIFLALVLLATASSSVHAQFGGGTEPLTISVTPSTPRPYDTVVITPKSNLLNLPATTISISVNGTVIEEGSGGRSASATLGGPGTKTVIRVTAVSNGETYSKEVIVAPVDVALIIEPMTVTPPFYDGAALVAPEGRVRIIAMADLRRDPTTRIPPEQLSYTWKLGDRVLTAESGIGRSVLSATAAPRYRDAQVSVTVGTTDGMLRGTAEARISAVSPELLLYKEDPLLGIDFAHALTGTVLLAQAEETYRAAPFHFASAPSTTWMLNGDTAGNEKTLTVRSSGREQGTARISAEASYANESADATFSLDFGRSRNSLFGF